MSASNDCCADEESPVCEKRGGEWLLETEAAAEREGGEGEEAKRNLDVAGVLEGVSLPLRIGGDRVIN